jgi:hypothetical protein
MYFVLLTVRKQNNENAYSANLFSFFFVLSELEKNMNSTFVYNQDILNAFTKLIEYGPNVTKSVVMAFIDPENLLVLFFLRLIYCMKKNCSWQTMN